MPVEREILYLFSSTRHRYSEQVLSSQRFTEKVPAKELLSGKQLIRILQSKLF